MWYVLMVFLIIGLIDLPRFIRQKRRWELVAYIVLFTTALTAAVLQSAGVKLPSPLNIIENFMEQINLIYPDT